MRFKVYDFIMWHSNCTAREAADALGMQTNQSGRFTELRNLGVIKETGKRKCRISGKTSITWDVTSLLPVKDETKKTIVHITIEQAEKILNRKTPFEIDYRIKNSLYNDKHFLHNG